MFWFLRRTGAASFLSSFNNNSTNGASKVTSYKNEKNNSGCHVFHQNRIIAFFCDVGMNVWINAERKKVNTKEIVKLCHAGARNSHLTEKNIGKYMNSFRE